MYSEEELLQISGIQHYAFCKRQWALAYIEMQWAENLRTVEGHLMHQRAHDSSATEKRGDTVISRAMPIRSFELGLSGECDVVEFHRDDSGVYIPKYDGRYIIVPIEYKRGSPKENSVDELQLCAQTVCLEEMLCTDIPFGYIFYGETRRRLKVDIDPELRKRLNDIVAEMHELNRRGTTPKAKKTRSCNACSLKDLCLPELSSKKTVKDYIASAINE